MIPSDVFTFNFWRPQKLIIWIRTKQMLYHNNVLRQFVYTFYQILIMFKGIKNILLMGRGSFSINKTHKIFEERIDKLVQTIRQQLKPSFLRVKDISLKTIDDDQMIRIEVESSMFKDIPKVDQHRMVIACFGQLIQDIHAFLIKTRIPLQQNVVIIKPEEQILQQQLNQQGTIPLQNIQKVVHQVQSQETPKVDKQLQKNIKKQTQQQKRKEFEENQKK